MRTGALGIDAEQVALGEDRLAVDSAPSAAEAPDRSIGTCPEPEKNTRWNQPLMPGR